MAEHAHKTSNLQFFRSVENPVDIFIRQQSRECETIIEEDEADLSEWHSTRTSQGVKSVHESVTRSRGSSPPGSNRRQSSLRRPDSPLKIVEFHSSHRIPSDMSQVDSQDISLVNRYPFYNKIKKQVMNLNFETSSDWSDEARFLDEVRDVGLKDEGRLTYHEMLLAYRRSQGIRRSTAKSIQSSDDESDSISSIHIDYLPSQAHSKQKTRQRPKHHVINDSDHVQHDRRSEVPSSKMDDIYVRLANGKSKSSAKPSLRQSKHSRQFGARRPVYNQSVYGQFPRIPNYQSYPNYPRYRNNVRPTTRPRPALYVYYLLAFILLVLIMISMIPIMFM